MCLHMWFWNNVFNKTAKSLQLFLTLCDPIDGLPPGSPVPGILQARALEWVAISFSNAKPCLKTGLNLAEAAREVALEFYQQ